MNIARAEILKLVADACEESKLHASYTFKRKQFKAAAFAIDAVLIGVRERLEVSRPARRARRTER